MELDSPVLEVFLYNVWHDIFNIKFQVNNKTAKQNLILQEIQ